ncbi:MAG: hypothetical protein FWD34_03115 [Oscillospiraceae bacterium]|nr:hypothetical protein [Oscillospiraceae bacterium]
MDISRCAFSHTTYNKIRRISDISIDITSFCKEDDRHRVKSASDTSVPYYNYSTIC